MSKPKYYTHTISDGPKTHQAYFRYISGLMGYDYRTTKQKSWHHISYDCFDPFIDHINIYREVPELEILVMLGKEATEIK